MSFLLTKAFWSRREKTDKCKSANGVFNPNCRSHTFTSDSKSPFNNNQLNKDNMTANSAGQGLGSIYGVQNGPNTGAASNSFSNSAGNLGLQPQHSPISPVQTPVRDNQSQSLTATHTRRKSCINYLESSSEDLSEQGSTSTCLGDTDRRINVRTLSLIVCTVRLVYTHLYYLKRLIRLTAVVSSQNKTQNSPRFWFPRTFTTFPLI